MTTKLTINMTTAAVLSLMIWGAPPLYADSPCALTVELVDAVTGQHVDGLIRLTTADDEPVVLKELQNRGLGLPEGLPIHEWWILRGRETLRVPRQPVKVQAFRGLDTKISSASLDLTGLDSVGVKLPLRKFFDAAGRGLRSGNTHIHLQEITRAEADRYLHEVPRADDLDLVFLSYLERVEADRRYVSNFYTATDLGALTGDGVLYCNGEEHRHNFTGFGEGYGHVMFLNLRRLVLPVSIGPGIMKTGTDGVPLQRGIDNAKSQGATVIWCHNEFGMEDLPAWLSHRIDAQNIFDGSITSSYKDTFYRYLNIGMKVPFSTGTDWFIYDLSRVYVPVDGALTVEKWLAALVSGKSYITNGPHLELRVGDRSAGNTLQLSEPQTLTVSLSATGRSDFGKVELIKNGAVVVEISTSEAPDGGYFVVRWSGEVEVREPCWFALRTPPPPLERPNVAGTVLKNEFGRALYAHTSPIYVDYNGRGVFDSSIVETMIAEVEANLKAIEENGVFTDNAARLSVLSPHREALERLQRLLGRRS